MGKMIDDLMHLKKDVAHIRDDVDHLKKDLCCNHPNRRPFLAKRGRMFDQTKSSRRRIRESLQSASLPVGFA